MTGPDRAQPARPTRLVVTGAAGMVAQSLIPRLLGRGWSVVALDKNSATLKVLGDRAPAAERHVTDLAEPGPWMDLFAGCAAVIDLKAQITSPDRGLHMRNNAAATACVLEACRRHKVPHLIHLSSSVVISKADDFYTESKRIGEASVRASGVPHTIFRPPLMFGPGDIKHLGLILSLMERFPLVPVPGGGQYLRQPLYVGDLCGVIQSALERPPAGEIFNVIGHEYITFIDLLRTIRSTRWLRCLLLPIPMAVFGAALGLQRLLLRRVMFTKQQLSALTAGDDFPVENWSEVFGVPFTSFGSVAAQIYGQEDDLRRRLMAAIAGSGGSPESTAKPPAQ